MRMTRTCALAGFLGLALAGIGPACAQPESSASASPAPASPGPASAAPERTPSAAPDAPAPAGSGEPAVAGTGVIEGQITVQEAGAPAADPDEVPFSNVVVYLDGFAPGTQFPPPTQEGRMLQRRKRYVPYILPVQVGSTVRFPNEDDIFHNVFSYSQTKKFNIGRYPKGPGKTEVFDKVGRVRVFCDIHSFMKANILVLSSPHFVLPDRTGKYRLSGAPSGTYWVTAWHDRLKLAQKRITMKPGETLKVDLTIQDK